MDSFKYAHKRMRDEYEDLKQDLDRRKFLWSAAYEMSQEWSGQALADPKLYWVTFTPDGIGVKRFNELMYKYFYHNPRFKIIRRDGLDEKSSQVSIRVKDKENNATMDIDLNKEGLTSCDVKTETEEETKEKITKFYLCKESFVESN